MKVKLVIHSQLLRNELKLDKKEITEIAQVLGTASYRCFARMQLAEIT